MRKSRKKIEPIPVKARLIKKSTVSDQIRSDMEELESVGEEKKLTTSEINVQKALISPSEWINLQLKTRTDPRKAFAALFNQSPQTQS